MKRLRLEVALLEAWHAGSGRGSGPVADAVPVRTPVGLPRLPGRTLRGLLREGVYQAETSGLDAVPPGTTERLFGAPDTPGLLRVSDATLGDDYEQWAAARRSQGEDVAATLFDPLAATAVDGATGQVVPRSLRTIEVAVPLTLTAEVYVLDEVALVRTALGAGLAFVRGLGAGRRRGLGRVRMRLVREED